MAQLVKNGFGRIEEATHDTADYQGHESPQQNWGIMYYTGSKPPAPEPPTTPAGRKDDQGKPDLTLVPYSALVAAAGAFGYGARKYARDNYKLGLSSSRLVAACLRHIHAWYEGTELDEESGVTHLGHALACLSMILECGRLGTLEDDRYSSHPDQTGGD